MIHKTIKINHTAGGSSMNTHRILMLMLMADAVCLGSVGVGMGRRYDGVDLEDYGGNHGGTML